MKTMLFAVLFALLSGCNLGAIDQPVNSNADPVDPNVCTPACGSDQLCEAGVCRNGSTSGRATFGSPSPQTIKITTGGHTGKATMPVTVITGPVTFIAKALVLKDGISVPAGFTATVSPTSLQSNGTLEITVTSGNSAEDGWVQVEGGNGAGTVHVHVAAPSVQNDFTANLNSATPSVTAGSKITLDIVTTVSSGISEQATVEVTLIGQACSNLTPYLHDGSIATGNSTKYDLTAATDAVSGECQVNVKLKTASAVHTISTTVAVVGAQPVVNKFNVSTNPSAFTVVQGVISSTIVNVLTTVVSGIAEAVTFSTSVSGSCSGVNPTLSQSSITAGNSVALSVPTTALTEVGTCTINVNATSPSEPSGHTATVVVTITVSGGGFVFTLTPASYSAVQGVAGVLSDIVAGSVSSGNAESVNYTITTGTGCVGFTTSVATATVMSNGSFTFDVDWAASAPVEVCTITVKGVSPSTPNGVTKTVVITLSGGGGKCTSDANCGGGKVCNLTTSTCITSGSVSAMGKCTVDADCQAGLSCVYDHGTSYCEAALCVSAGLTGYMCWPFTSTDTPVSPTAVTVVVNNNGYRSMDLQCCPNNGVFGSVTAYGSTPPTGCKGTGEKYTADLTDCHPITGYAANGHQR